MSRKRIAWSIAGGLTALAVVAIVSGILVLRSAWFREKVRTGIISTLETATGGRVEIGSFELDWKQVQAKVNGLVIHGTEPVDKPPLLRAESITVGLKIISALKRNVDVQFLDVASPRIYLIVAPDGRTNVPEPKIKSSGGRPATETILNLAVGRFSVRDGVFEVESHGQTPFDARGQNLNAKFLYERIGPRYRGDISIQPLAFAWSDYAAVPLGVTMALTIEKNRIGLDSAKLTTGDTRIGLSGAVEDLLSPHGEFHYDANVSLRDVNRILRVPELRQGTALVTGIATWAGSSNFSAIGKLRAHGMEYRDSLIRLRDFRADGTLTANAKGVDLKGAQLTGNYTDASHQIPVDVTIANVALRGKDLELSSVAVEGLDAHFRGEARLRNLDRYTVIGDVSGVRIKRVVALYSPSTLPWDGLVSGPVHLEGSLRRPKELRASGDLAVTPAAAGAPVHGQITASYEALGATLDLGRSTLTLPSSRVDFSGNIGRELRVHLETRDLNDILPAIGESAAKVPVKLLNGGVIFDGAVTGNLDLPHIAGHVRSAGFSYAGEIFDSLEADVNAAPDTVRVQNATLVRGRERAQFQLTVGLAEWKTDDQSPISGDGTIRNAAVADLAALIGSKTVPATGTLNGTAQLAGSIGNPLITADIDVAKGSLSDEPFDRFTAQVNYTSRAVEIKSSQLNAGAKQVQLSAAFDHAADRFDTGRLRFQVSSNAMALDQIKMLEQARPGVQGTVQVTASGTVDLSPAPTGKPSFRVVDLHGDLSAKGLQLTGQPLGDAHVTAISQGQVLRAHLESNIAHSTVLGDGEWRLEGDYPGTATVKFSKLDFAQLKNWISPSQSSAPMRFTGSAEGELRLAGALLKQQLTAELHIPKLDILPGPDTGLAPGTFAIHNADPIVVKMAKSVITVESAHLAGGSTDVTLSGKVLTDQKNPLDLRVNGHVNLAILKEFSRDLESSGSVVADATVRGSLDSPQLNGHVEFQKAAFNLADVPNGISNATGVVFFTKERATIQSFVGETGGGKIELTGFAGYGPSAVFRIHAAATEVRVRYPEGVSTVANASLDLTGNVDSSMLQGTVMILRTGFNLQSDFSSILAKSAEPVYTPAAQTGFLAGLNFDVQIETAPDIQLQSSLTQNLQAEATLRLKGTASNPALLGRINITGGQVIFFGTKYTISQGSVAFYNPVKVEPILNVDLETKARGVDVTLNVSGPATKLNMTPRSDPPLQFNEIVSLLATGRTPTSDPSLLTQQSSAPQSFQQAGASALLGQAIANPVAGRLQRFFGVSNLRIDPTLPGVENNPQARLTLEQQVTPDITFTYITNVTNSNPQVVRAEWAFARQWSVVLLREENGLVGFDFFFKKRFK